MNEILQQRIEKAARNFNRKEGIPYALIGHVFNAFMEGAAFVLQNQWISVNEALPEFEGNFSEYCIIRTENGFCAATTYYRTSTKEYWWNFEKVKVTRWMPIPEMKGVKK